MNIYGRSARSFPAGKGARGGRWHDPEYRRAYFRQWRASHPEYRERDNRRRLLSKNLARLVRVLREAA